MTTRCYSELQNLATFEERYHYLKLSGAVGIATFGFDRYLNQRFYRSREWKSVRDFVIVRDEGCDLGVPGHEIHVGGLIHHMNPIREQDILSKDGSILDPEFLITTSLETHNAIHYGVESLAPRVVTARSPGDTKLW